MNKLVTISEKIGIKKRSAGSVTVINSVNGISKPGSNLGPVWCVHFRQIKGVNIKDKAYLSGQCFMLQRYLHDGMNKALPAQC